MHHTPEASRPRAVWNCGGPKVAWPLRVVRADRADVCHAQQFARGLQEAGFAVLNDVMINQVLVSFGRPDVTREVIRRIHEDGTAGAPHSLARPISDAYQRLFLATTEADVKRSLASMIRMPANAARSSSHSLKHSRQI